MYKLFISLRYLRARTISYIAIGALGLGVAILIIVTSVMGGFQREFHKKIRGTLSDISVESKIFFGMKNGPELQRRIEALPRVQATAPFIENLVLIESDVTRDFGQLKGVDAAQEARIGDFASYLLSERELVEARFEGRPALRGSSLVADLLARASAEKPTPTALLAARAGRRPGILVGVELFKFMKMEIGDKLALVTTAAIHKERFEESDARKMEFEVAGVFKTGMFETDKRVLYAALEPVQEFIGMPGRLSGLNVKLDDYRAAQEVADAIYLALEDPYLMVLPWSKRNENLIRAVATEQWMIGFIVFFMIILAGLTLTAILTMLVIEKTKDLGILAAVGASSGGLMTIFLLQGLFIAVFGSLTGLALGLLFVDNINWIDRSVMATLLGHPVFNPEVYYLDRIPTEVSMPVIGLCIGATLVLGVLLALYPAIRAANLEPMEALRYE